jgi:hypothetical protein
MREGRESGREEEREGQRRAAKKRERRGDGWWLKGREEKASADWVLSQGQQSASFSSLRPEDKISYGWNRQMKILLWSKLE